MPRSGPRPARNRSALRPLRQDGELDYCWRALRPGDRHSRAWRVHRIRMNRLCCDPPAAIATVLATLTRTRPSALRRGGSACGRLLQLRNSRGRVLFRGRGTAYRCKSCPTREACADASPSFWRACLLSPPCLQRLERGLGHCTPWCADPQHWRPSSDSRSADSHGPCDFACSWHLTNPPLAVVGSAVLIRLAWGASSRASSDRKPLRSFDKKSGQRPLVPAKRPRTSKRSRSASVSSIAAAFTAICLFEIASGHPLIVGWFQLAAWLIITFAFQHPRQEGAAISDPDVAGRRHPGGIGIAAARPCRRTAPCAPTGTHHSRVDARNRRTVLWIRSRTLGRSSPRDLISELPRNDVLLYRVFSFEFTTPALDYYSTATRVVGDPRERIDGRRASWSVDRLIESIRRSGRRPSACFARPYPR